MTAKIHAKKAYFFGFSRWKHGFVKPFFNEYTKNNLIFINPLFSSHLQSARKKGLDADSDIYIWGRKSFPDIETFAQEHKLNLFRVEDGFIRSIGLGSDLTQPYSLVIDPHGIYFDPTQPSLLETILNTYDFQADTTLLQRAQTLKEIIINNKISKYNADASRAISFATDKTTALVVGQVEDDASIKFGAQGMRNLELLQTVRQNNPDTYLIYKPHPDVLSGNRIGNITEEEALKYCNMVVTEIAMANVLEAVDEIHTMTSLTGFEGLLYGKKVYTYGVPFYAGWGLSIDCAKEGHEFLQRRSKKLSLQALIAATYILYPRYIHPKDKQTAQVEDVIRELTSQKKLLENSLFLRIKFKIYSYLSRLTQKLLSLVM